ncbi:phosphoribosylformylglycinamidine cyclo-ligase [Candidatus Saccharibacteria bacterium]|nr:MAG: phosphoribosylformylglycinamidine cyclo-ligase [Candidatus Saccharibacteria bacterium]
MTKKLDYYASVNYDLADPAKVLAQKEGLATASNMPYGYSEVSGTRGESAYVFDMGDRYGALVQEGLGTKSLIAQKVYQDTGTSYFAAIAQDTVATVINDLISVGAKPVVLNAYWSAQSYDWLADNKLTTDFIKGWRAACDKAGVVWGGGETQSLPGIVTPGALEFAGSGFGVITPKSRIVQDANLAAGDAIILLESSGVHANGISMTRQIAEQLPDGYHTKLSDGNEFGVALLQPTILYAEVLQELFAKNIDLHYVSNITGHGWRKLMRGKPKLTYRMTDIGTPQPVFAFIQEHSGNSIEDMYHNYNMGAGYAVFVPADQAIQTIEIAQKCGIKAWQGGVVETGPKQVVIEPVNITFGGETLEVR